MKLDSWISQKKKEKIYKEENLENKDISINSKKYNENNTTNNNLYLLVSADYDPDAKSVFLKLYDVTNNTIKIIYDVTGHKPYAYSKQRKEELKTNPHVLKFASKIINLEEEIKHDPIKDEEIVVTKIIVEDPLVIGGTSTSLRNFIKLWEADIKYYANYIFDTGLNIGKHYIINNGWLKEAVVSHDEVVENLVRNYVYDEKNIKWIKLLAENVPRYKILAVDIEVYIPEMTRVPQPDNPRDPIFIFSFMGSDGLKKILLYNLRNEEIKGDTEFELEVFSNEKEMIARAMEIMRNYPIIITFNGDNFDLRYIKKRAESLNLHDIVKDIRLGKNDARVDWGIHIDLYRFFKNVSIKNYAFGGKYDEVTLDSLGKNILGISKLEISEGFDKYPLIELCKYSFRDAEITYKLVSFNDQLVMKLITIISRIANMTLDDVCRLSVSNWIRNRLINIHRDKNYLIPLPEEVREKGGGRHFEPVTKGKKYKGAIVASPKAGLHFNVYVLDFASLYPSIMKEYNISYETVNCPHQECTNNKIPETTTWVCTKKRGIVSEFVGLIRDIRVKIFKKLAKDPKLPKNKREFYNVIQNALKVYINAIYGVFGSEDFFLFYLPAAEAVTTLGRHAILVGVEETQKLGLEVIYGDTDSLFIKNPDPEKLDILIENITKRLKLQLEIDKIYRYVVFSKRKKNYFGVLSDGTLDVKGLIGKKSNTPEFIKKVFYKILEELKNITSEDDFYKAKNKIIEIISDAEEKIRRKDVKIEEMAISVTLSKPLSEYTKTTPQHVKAAKLLISRLKKQIVPGSVIKYVKTTNQYKVKPVELVRDPREIDSEKYIDLLWSTITQITDALEISTKSGDVSKRLDQFFV